jgi:hypothetical protein
VTEQTTEVDPPGLGTDRERTGVLRGVVLAVTLSLVAVVMSTLAFIEAGRGDDVAPEAVPSAMAPPPDRRERAPSDFPTSLTTGPRVDVGDLRPSGPVVTSRNGQVIERLDVRTQIVVQHSDVVIRDVRIRYDSAERFVYPIHVRPRCDSCAPPENVLIEYVEIAGEPGVNLGNPAVFGREGNWTLRFAEIHGIGSGPRLTSNTAVEYSYVHSMPDTDPEEHKSAVGTNGGSGNRVIGSRLECAVSGCSAALAMYGDFTEVRDVLVEGNLFNTSGSYCVYGGSLEGKAHPEGTEIRFVDNVFGREYQPDCGIYGPVTAFDPTAEGNLWEGNTWAATGEPVLLGAA